MLLYMVTVNSPFLKLRLSVLTLFVEADSDLICQAGARWEDINRTLKEDGIPLFFPVSDQCILLCGNLTPFTA